MENKTQETVTLGGGCFWCMEEFFVGLKGIKNIILGYSGGHVENPSYKQVCSGATGHAEVVQITFTPEEISYEEILRVFFAIHNPTTLNRQGVDVGSNYRSVIFYHSPEQKEIAESIINELTVENLFSQPIVTEVTAFTGFYPSEGYNKSYVENDIDQPYCLSGIAPKISEFRIEK